MKMGKFTFVWVIMSTITMTACMKKEEPTPPRRYQVTCIDVSGKEYYNKVAKDIWNREGSISVQREDGKWDAVMGNCKAEEL